jgi:hypothetical protein
MSTVRRHPPAARAPRVARINGRLRQLTPYERRLVLAVQTLLRWKRLSVYWPAEATCATEADPQWQHDVLHHYLSAVLGPLDVPAPLLDAVQEVA